LKLKRARKDFQQKLSTQLWQESSTIVLEDLKVSNMLRNPGLAKHIADVGWFQFRSMLEYKAEWYSKEFLVVPPNYTSQQCRKCRYIHAGNRKSQAIFHCLKCGHTENADLNASFNILSKGIAHRTQRKAVA
jgi:putative transposase